MFKYGKLSNLGVYPLQIYLLNVGGKMPTTESLIKYVNYT